MNNNNCDDKDGHVDCEHIGGGEHWMMCGSHVGYCDECQAQRDMALIAADEYRELRLQNLVETGHVGLCQCCGNPNRECPFGGNME